MTALVTGGARSIGHAIVEELVGLGASVHTCDRDEIELNESLRRWKALGLPVTVSVCDVTSRAERERLMKRVSASFDGKLDILLEQSEAHSATGIRCYMKDNGVSEEEARLKMGKMVEDAWKTVNLEMVKPSPIPIEVRARAHNLVCMMEVIFRNTDNYNYPSGEMKDNVAISAFGAVIRDPNGDCLSALAARTNAASINVLELKGTAHGLKLYHNLGYPSQLKVWSESDSSTAIAWSKGKGLVPWSAFRDLRLIQQISAQFLDWKVSYTFRDGNRVADILAATRSSMGSSIFDPLHLPGDVQRLIDEEKTGFPHIRKS
ncbi:hypothetical protein QJS10_CPA06g00011 [Acorus calamus]|uniref:RNase H type-1 domain-containing protein n=1 Tax=Acorus calamus TaxID=4465 RepID=A0AAV9EL99_ACOCL|nr:hypothetical protein QJS10_CPA06g00011 [Acorus calamus]